jgi:hypothetical protein
MAVWYVRDNSTVATDTFAIVAGSVGWSAMTGWTSGASISAGALRRQSARTAAFTASTSGSTTLNVTAVSAGALYVGQHIESAGGNTFSITALGTGTGGTGSYTLNLSSTVGSQGWNGGLQAGNERAFVAIVGGTTGSTEPGFTLTKGAKTTDNTVTWQECTGQPAVNGDLTNTPLSSSVRSSSPGLGKIIQDNSGTHIFIQTSAAGTTGSGEPTYNTSALGNNTTDGTVTWTYIGTSFSSWAAPHARHNNATASTWAAAGDTFYFGDDHAEIIQPVTATNLMMPGTNASPCFAYSIDHTASLPPGSGNLLAGASIATQGATSLALNDFGTSCCYYYGVTFTAGSGNNSATLELGFAGVASWTKLDTCKLVNGGTASGGRIVFGSAQTGAIELVNTTLQFGNTGQVLRATPLTRCVWRNTPSAIAGATIPTNLFDGVLSSGVMILEGVDLSALGSNTIVPAGTSAGSNAMFQFIDCKLGSGAVIAATPVNINGPLVDAISCDSGATNYVQRRYWYQGTLQEETTIVRTGGASDGTTPISWKIVTTANSKWTLPFESFPISIWNSNTSVTITVYGIWGGGAVPNTDDIWFEVAYLGSSGSPQASFANTTKSNNLASGSPLSSDNSHWGGSTTAFKMSVTIAPQLAGYLRVTVKAAKATSTFYIDPLVALS